MKLMILDGNSVINRAFYGVRPLTTRDGLYTNAIYGFLNILEKERSEEKPDALCVAFDLHAPTFRHLRYDGYKATRHPMPEELAMQMPVMKQVLAAMNIPVYACEGWEADDVLGTVGRLCEEAGWDCAILTGDRDSLQLVDEHVSVRLVHTQGGQTRTERYTPDVFRAEYGLEPKRLIDLKALMGDSSDNIPGVAGVGPKTANDLLQRFGTLDGVYANLSRENMKGKLFDKLENGRRIGPPFPMSWRRSAAMRPSTSRWRTISSGRRSAGRCMTCSPRWNSSASSTATACAAPLWSRTSRRNRRSP